MVLINDKKYACATCIKGHRVSGCTHTDRPLFEVKKKGRPATQCQFCREKRKGGGGTGSVHSKCACGDLKNQQPASIILGPDGEVQPNPAVAPPVPSQMETKKGQPGSTPTFPNGLRDVHEMAAAAQALSGLGDNSNQAAERKLQNLLNPCNCATTGKCKCCGPKRSRDYPPPRRTTPPRDTHAQVTDSLIEMFKSKATTAVTTPTDSGSSTPQQTAPFASLRAANLAMTSTSNNLASPDNRHHPSHTSPHVHKTRLYSPYASNGSSTPRKSGKTRSESVSSTGSISTAAWPGASNTGTSPRPPPNKIRPLTDMNRFLGAAFLEDGSIASEISRSALGLPGIHAFDTVASNGGVKVESMEMDVDVPVAFPTAEDVVIGACTCGDGCECPGCVTHGNSGGSPSHCSPNDHRHEGCGDACKSCFDCSENVSIPSGVTSIEHLIQVAASKVPSNPPRAHAASDLNPLDTKVLPPAANMSEDAARAFGLVQLLPLKCCNGRCQCPPGQCSCESECCGCCTRCLCEHDGDAIMAENDDQERTSGGCCSTSSPVAAPPPIIQTQQEPSPGGCCSSSSPAAPPRPAIQTQMLSVGGTGGSPNTLSPTSPTAGRQPSPTPPNGPLGARRNSSVSRAKEAANTTTTSRRVSVSNGSNPVARSASTGKTAAKALALHPNQPRPILPKPSASRLALPRTNSSGSRQPSPVHRGSISGSSQPSEVGSPVAAPATLATPVDNLNLPDSGASDTVSNPGDLSGDTLQVPGVASGTDAQGMPVGVDDIANALAASDVDFLAYLNSLLNTGENPDAVAAAAAAAAGPSAAPDSLAGSGYSFTTSLAVSSATTDLSLLGIAQSASPGHPTRTAGVESSMGDIQQLIASTLEQQGMMPRPDGAPGDYGYLLNMPPGGNQQQVYGFGNSNSLAVPTNPLLPTTPPPLAPHAAPPQPHAQQPHPPPQSHPPPQQAHAAQHPHPQAPVYFKPEQNMYFPNFGPGFPHLSQPHLAHDAMRSASRGSTGGEVVSAHLPPQVPPTQPTQPPAPAPAHATPPSHSAPPAHTGPNPDIIDLSKPLNPSDVDRILQALLTQQGRSGGAPAATAPPPEAQPQPVAPGAERSDVFEDYMFDPAMVDIQGQHPQSQHPPGPHPPGPNHHPTALQQQQHREWLLKNGWPQNIMGQAPPA